MLVSRSGLSALSLLISATGLGASGGAVGVVVTWLSGSACWISLSHKGQNKSTFKSLERCVGIVIAILHDGQSIIFILAGRARFVSVGQLWSRPNWPLHWWQVMATALLAACAVSTSLCDKRQRLSQCGQWIIMLSLCVIFLLRLKSLLGVNVLTAALMPYLFKFFWRSDMDPYGSW